MKSRILLVIFAGMLLVPRLDAHADSRSSDLKSVGLAIALGLDPIPADALFYAEKPIQGTFNLLLGGTGAYLFWYGLYKHATYSNPMEGRCSDLSCSDFSDMGNALMMVGGGLLYFPALLWDGIGGVSGVKSHNDRIRKRQSAIWRAFQPTVGVTNDGFFAGAQFRF